MCVLSNHAAAVVVGGGSRVAVMAVVVVVVPVVFGITLSNAKKVPVPVVAVPVPGGATVRTSGTARTRRRCCKCQLACQYAPLAE